MIIAASWKEYEWRSRRLMEFENKLMLVDGNSILNRAFYGLKGPGGQILQTSRGEYTNAVYGFLNILNMYLETENPGYLCVAFDLKAPTFRHRQYDQYKATRTGMPEELASQVPLIKEVLGAMNILCLEREGYEADDLIGSVSLCAEKEGLDVVIVTGDRDALQLASDRTRILMPVTKGGKTETKEYTRATIKEEYGIEPAQFIDVKGLMGDTSDNIPGIKGIGEKTALALVQEFGSIENLFSNLDKVGKESIKSKLEGNYNIARLSRELAEINRQVPGLCNIADLKRVPLNKPLLYEIFRRLEFRTFIEKYGLEPAAEQIHLKEVNVVETLRDLKQVLDKCMETGKVSMVPFFDNVNRPLGLAIAWDSSSSAFIRMDNIDTSNELLNNMSGILANSSIKKYGHDIKRFLVFLKTKGIGYTPFDFDSMIAAYILNSSRSNYGIAEISNEYLGVSLPPLDKFLGKGKEAGNLSETDIREFSSVAGLYAETVYKLKDVIDSQLESNGQRVLYYEIELPLVEVLADMEFWGIKVDINLLEDFSWELKKKIEQVTWEIFKYAGEEFNINSTKQLGTVLFEKLKLPVIKRTKTGYSTDAEVLEKLSGMHPIVDHILYYRQLVKLQSTYVDGLLNVVDKDTGKIHSSFNQTVVVTGRISSTEPNLQNIPIRLDMGRNIRKVFVPSGEDYVFIDADYSQIELRVLAHITEDENLIRAFAEGVDIHAVTASQIFNTELANVTPAMRSAAKAVNFGIIYGIGDFSLSQDLKISRKEAKKYIDDYLDRYPRVRDYMKNIVDEGKEKGYVTTIFNRRRYIPELKSNNSNIRSFGERIALNTPIQGSAADIIKIAMVKVYNTLKERKMKSRLILQVHDELLLETHRDEVSEVKKILRECMENAVRLKVPLVVDMKTGNSWYETK